MYDVLNKLLCLFDLKFGELAEDTDGCRGALVDDLDFDGFHCCISAMMPNTKNMDRKTKKQGMPFSFISCNIGR